MALATLEAVVPVRLSGAHERLTGARFQLLLESLELHWVDPAPLRLTVVGMAEELGQLRELAAVRAGLELRFLDERRLIGDPRIMALPGWFKQTFIKLLFAGICEADAYLYLDADVVCVRDLSLADLIQDGLAVSGWEPKGAHPGWWAASRRVLGRQASDRTWGLTVTPNVLARAIAAAIPAFLAAGGHDPLTTLLAHTGDAEACWVENAIYTEMGEMTGDLDRLHATLSYHTPYRSDADIWALAELDTWRPVEALAAAPHARFVVVQSTMGLDPAYVRQRLAPFLTKPGFPDLRSGS
jgi:hypothetical protein